MSLRDDIISNIDGYSKAMYATWFYYKPARILLDAGEGVSPALGNGVFGIENVFLSHGHFDHVSGVPGLVLSRKSARGDKEKPMTIHYPQGDRLVGALREYVANFTAGHALGLSYDLTWRELEPGDRIPLGESRDRGYMEVFRTLHSRRHLTLGYKICETRTRLRAEHSHLTEREIAAIAREHGRDGLMEEYEKKLLVYGGDSMPLDPDEVRDAEVLMHDSSFLDEGDREEPTHATMEEALRVAIEANVGAVILFHVSSRYPRPTVEKHLRKLIEKYPLDRPVVLVINHRMLTFGPES